MCVRVGVCVLKGRKPESNYESRNSAEMTFSLWLLRFLAVRSAYKQRERPVHHPALTCMEKPCAAAAASVFLTPEEKGQLSKHPETLLYPLSESQLQFLDKNGYLVLKKIVDEELCRRIVAEAFQRAELMFGLRRDAPSTWNAIPIHGVADIWHLPAQYELRQHPALYSVFAQLLKTHRLCATLDRVAMNPPRRANVTNVDLELHTDLNYWHADISCPGYQGGLCLEDCPPGGGRFYCIPGFHRSEEVERYKRDVESGRWTGGVPKVPSADKHFVPFLDQDYANKRKIEIPLEQGDYIVWNNFLPHTGGFNTLENHWRLHCFARFLALYGPASTAADCKRNARYQRQHVLPALKSGERPKVYASGGETRAGTTREPKYHTPPQLSELGRKVFGLDPW